MYITILSLFFVRFLLYVVYVFELCSPYLEDNKVSIYLRIIIIFRSNLEYNILPKCNKGFRVSITAGLRDYHLIQF